MSLWSSGVLYKIFSIFGFIHLNYAHKLHIQVATADHNTLAKKMISLFLWDVVILQGLIRALKRSFYFFTSVYYLYFHSFLEAVNNFYKSCHIIEKKE